MKQIDFLKIMNTALQWVFKIVFLLLLFLLFLAFLIMENVGKAGVRIIYPRLFNKQPNYGT